MSWSQRFEEPIELPDGRKLKTIAVPIDDLRDVVGRALLAFRTSGH